MRKKSFVWTFILSLLLIIPGIVSAEEEQNPLRMEELTVQVLPEFTYHPEDEKKNEVPLLVGYHGALMNITDEPLKGKIAIPLPVNDRNFKIGYVADYSKDLTEMYDIEYELDQEAGVITWETSEEIQPQEIYKFVIEYYTDTIQQAGEKKTLDFHFTSFADIGIVNIIFVEPLKTDSFILEPASDSHSTNPYNMNLFLYSMQNAKMGEEREITLTYERADDRTTAEIMEEMMPNSTQQASSAKNEEHIPVGTIILVVGGITIVIAIVLIYFLRKKPRKKVSKVVDKEESDTELKKAKLRAMLVDGSITEEEYNELLKKIGGK